MIADIGSRMPEPRAVSEVQLRRDALEAVYGQLGRAPCGQVRELKVPAPSSAPGGSVAARLYWPRGDDPCGVLIWLHGGAWLAGSIESHDAMCRLISNRSGAAVVNVGYRLAPEHPFPCGLEDAVAALIWVADNADDLGARGGGLVIGGDSAGATLSAVTAIIARDDGIVTIARQILVYPATDLSMSTPSWDEYGSDEYGLSRAEVTWSRAQYGADPRDWRASPLLAVDLGHLAPATVITAECDPLRDEAERFGERIIAAGGVAAVHRYTGMVHGFVGLVGLHASDHAISRIATDVAAAVRTQ